MSKLAAFLIFTVPCLTLAQTSSRVRTALEEYVTLQGQEKIYLHLPKYTYVQGETIWFRAYHGHSLDHQPTESRLLYMELVRDTAIVESRLIELINGMGSGDIEIHGDIGAGQYTLRAYTQWMRNFDNQFFYAQEIKILGSERQDHQELSSELVMDFFPEGGDLIQGVGSKVASKVIGSDGRGRKVSGRIIDQNDRQITTFSTKLFGMGEFYLRPEPDVRYRAMIDSLNLVFELPEARSSGASMSVRHTPESEEVRIVVSAVDVDLAGSVLIGQSNGRHLFEVENQRPEAFVALVPKSAFAAGINHLTVFDKDLHPLAERLVYVKHPEAPNFEIRADQPSYQTRSAVKLAYSIPDSTVTNLSMSVTALPEIANDTLGRNIRNYLTLSSDLVGFIESPEHYFSGSAEAYDDLDLLLRTHGWRRFVWQDLLKGQFDPPFSREQTLTKQFQVLDFYNQKKTRQADITVVTRTEEFNLSMAQTDEDGFLELEGFDFRDTTEVLITARGTRGRKDKPDRGVLIMEIEKKPPGLTEVLNKNPVRPTQTTEDKALKISEIRQAFGLDKDAIVLEELVTTATRIDERFDRVPNLYSKPDVRVLSEDILLNPLSVMEMLRTVAGVTLTGNFPNQSLSIRGYEPMFILDNMVVDADAINSIPVSSVDFIDVIKGLRATIIQGGAKAAVIVYTKMGPDAGKVGPSGTLDLTVPGFYQAREFYAPRYDVHKQEHVIPDYRSVLYWNPSLTFENSKGSVDFYTSDEVADYYVKVEGLTSTGIPVFRTIHIRVE